MVGHGRRARTVDLTRAHAQRADPPSYLTKRFTQLLHNFMIQLATRKLWADIFMVYRWTLALETWYRLYESYLQTRSTHHMPEPNMREEPSSA